PDGGRVGGPVAGCVAALGPEEPGAVSRAAGQRPPALPGRQEGEPGDAVGPGRLPGASPAAGPGGLDAAAASVEHLVGDVQLRGEAADDRRVADEGGAGTAAGRRGAALLVDGGASAPGVVLPAAVAGDDPVHGDHG